MLLKRTSQARYKYMAIFGELVPSWLYSQLQVIDPISGVRYNQVFDNLPPALFGKDLVL